MTTQLAPRITPSAIKHDRRAVLDFIIAYKRANDGLSPTLREICDGCHIAGVSTARYILAEMQRRGWITVDGKRGIRVAGGRWDVSETVTA